MATRIKPEVKSVYDQDFYVWTEVQAELLRQRRFEALDLDNLIEEVEGLGDAKKSAVLSNASVIIEHLLKLQLSPAHGILGAAGPNTILEHRDRLELELTPRLRQILEDELPSLYALTRRTDRAPAPPLWRERRGRRPARSCPYGVDQITGDWWP